MVKTIFAKLMGLWIITFASYAQTTDETDDAEEVLYTLPTQTVTAEKREEVLQKVPIAVTSVNDTRTEELQIYNINQVGRISPNLKSYDDGAGLYPMIASRGIFTMGLSSSLLCGRFVCFSLLNRIYSAP